MHKLPLPTLNSEEPSPLYGLPPDIQRFEAKFREKDALKKIGLYDRSIEGALRFENRVGAFQTILRKHGIKAIPDDPIRPLAEFYDSLGSNARQKYFHCFSKPTAFLKFILHGDFKSANKRGVRPKESPYSETRLKNLRRDCFKLGLYVNDPLDNYFLVEHAKHIFESADGFYATMPDWKQFCQPKADIQNDKPYESADNSIGFTFAKTAHRWLFRVPSTSENSEVKASSNIPISAWFMQRAPPIGF